MPVHAVLSARGLHCCSLFSSLQHSQAGKPSFLLKLDSIKGLHLTTPSKPSSQIETSLHFDGSFKFDSKTPSMERNHLFFSHQTGGFPKRTLLIHQYTNKTQETQKRTISRVPPACWGSLHNFIPGTHISRCRVNFIAFPSK